VIVLTKQLEQVLHWLYSLPYLNFRQGKPALVKAGGRWGAWRSFVVSGWEAGRPSIPSWGFPGHICQCVSSLTAEH